MKRSLYAVNGKTPALPVRGWPVRGWPVCGWLVCGWLVCGAVLTCLLVSLTGCGGNASASSDKSILAGLVPGFDTPSPGAAARDAFNVYDADKRRRSVVLLSNASWGGEAPYLKTYRLLVDDPDPTVRAAAIAALGRWGDPTDVPALGRLLDEKNESSDLVRWEAAKALQRIHDEKAIAPLAQALITDIDADVRQASAMALGQYPSRRAFDALVGGLDDDDFAVVTASAESLKTLTGQDYADDGERWWQWAKDNPNIFADKQTYYYPQYHKRPSMIDRVQFWKDTSEPTPKQPRTEIAAVGAEPTALTGSRPTGTRTGTNAGSSLYDFEVPARLPNGELAPINDTRPAPRETPTPVVRPRPNPDRTVVTPPSNPAPPAPPETIRPDTVTPPPADQPATVTTNTGASVVTEPYDAGAPAEPATPTVMTPPADTATTTAPAPATTLTTTMIDPETGERVTVEVPIESTATTVTVTDPPVESTASTDTAADSGEGSSADDGSTETITEEERRTWHIFGASDGR